jgi:peptidoglycan-N-acetylglucosamine deacetylase
MMNAISVDVEEWTHAELLRGNRSKRYTHRVEAATQTLLDLFEHHGVTATFFILGEVARDHPQLVKRIHHAGHEISSHGFTHTNLNQLNQKSFEKELLLTETALKKACGVTPKGFRAPTFSIGLKTAWALLVLEKRRYVYDSSIFPVHTGMYGLSNSPLHPYHPDLTHMDRQNKKTRLLEIPPAVFSFRLYPYSWLKYGIEQIEKQNRPAVLYIHPWEFDLETPIPPGLSFKDKFISFYGQKNALKKLDRLLKEFEFGTMQQAVKAWL